MHPHCPHVGILHPLICPFSWVHFNIKAFVDAPAVYQNAPSFAYVIGDYTVSKSGTVSGPVNEALMAALNANGFIVD